MAQRNHLDLFGLDLSPLVAGWRRGWAELFEYLSMRGMLPAHPVTLLRSDGSRIRVSVPGFTPMEGKEGRWGSGFHAVELPSDIVLEREITAPLSPDHLHAALRLEVEASSPFEPEDTVWGWRPPQPGSSKVQLVITSRRFVQAHLERAGSAEEPEVWAPVGDGYAVVQGFGEHRRHAARGRQLRTMGVLAGLAVMLAAALAVSPLLQKRQQVIELESYAAAMAARAAPAVAMREELGRLIQLQHSLGATEEGGPDVVELLDDVTGIIPDGAWLDVFEHHPGRLRLSGRADDAAALLQALQAHPAFTNVRAPSPISREPGTNKERFVIELDLVK